MNTFMKAPLLIATILFSLCSCKKRDPEGPGGDRRVKEVYTTMWSSFALLETGEVLSWGRNDHGGLGNGNELATRNEPGLVSGLSNVETLVVASSAAFARTKTGAWYAWGLKDALGQAVSGGGPTGINSPVSVRDLGKGKLHGGIFDFFLAHDQGTGAVSGWGFNYDGQATGTPTRGATSAQLAPTTVPLSGTVKLLAPCDVYSIAVMTDNTLRFWGSAAYGPGANLRGAQSVATMEPGLPSGSIIKQIAVAHSHVVVLLGDGSLWAWGNNEYSKFGTTDLQPTIHRAAVRLTAFPAAPIRQIAASSIGTVILYEDGSVWRSGGVTNGVWDDFTPIVPPFAISEPEAVTGLPPIAKVSANGSGHVLALAKDGSVWAWGPNEFGQLGNGSTVDSVNPVRVAGL